MSEWNTHPYYTHQPILRYYAEAATQPILELGCGEGSTRLLHAICATKGLELVTVENNRSWMDRYRDLAHEHHTFIAVPDDGDAEAWVHTLQTHGLDQKAWGVVFVDQSPWEARTASINLLKDQTDLVILHDADYFPEHGIFGRVLRRIARNVPGLYDFRDQFSQFKLYYPPPPWCCDTGPPTLVATQRQDLKLADRVPSAFLEACPDPH